MILFLKTARGSLEGSEVSDHDLVFGNYTGRLALISYFYSVINANISPDLFGYAGFIKRILDEDW